MLLLKRLFKCTKENYENIARDKGYQCPHCCQPIVGTTEGFWRCARCRRGMVIEGERKIYKVFLVECPYCKRGHVLKEGYYQCKCNNCFRVQVDKHSEYKVLKAEETISDVLNWGLFSLMDALYLESEVTQERINFFTNLLIDTFDLNEEQIKWCIENSSFPNKPTTVNPFEVWHIANSINLKDVKALKDIDKEYLESFSLILLRVILGIVYFDRKENEKFEKGEHLIYEMLGISYEEYYKIKKEVKEFLYQDELYEEENMKEYFKILDIDKNSNVTEIRKAYRRMINIFKTCSNNRSMILFINRLLNKQNL